MLLTIPPPAVAAPPDPAVEQYVESVPRADGDRPLSGVTRGELPDSLRRGIEAKGGPDAAALEAVAVSPALGAPAIGNAGEAQRAAGADTRGQTATGGTDPVRRSPFAAAWNATTDADDSTAGLLLAGLVGVAAIAVAARLRRPHSR